MIEEAKVVLKVPYNQELSKEPNGNRIVEGKVQKVDFKVHFVEKDKEHLYKN